MDAAKIWIPIPDYREWQVTFVSAYTKAQMKEAPSHPKQGVFFFHRISQRFLHVNEDDLKVVCREESYAPRWQKLLQHIDLNDPTRLLNQVYLGVHATLMRK